MNILVTGSGRSGSWQIRGEQLGRTMGATVLPAAIDIAPFDVAVVVKRPPAELVQRIHRADVPLVWDVVDAWPQPGGNEWSRAQCMAWLRQQVAQVRPAAIVAATEQMGVDCAEFGIPVLVLPHHARPGLRLNPIRPLAVVGYEGGEGYITRWAPIIRRECQARGLHFAVGPEELADVDIVLALRDQLGYAARHWKSGVKLANAQGSGTPVICAREHGYMENASGAELWADTHAELVVALDALTATADRQAISRRLRQAAPSLDAIATRYTEWLHRTFSTVSSC